MGETNGNGPGDVDHQIEQTLEKCLEWSQAGEYDAILAEVDKHLPELVDHPNLHSALLVWKAQAHLATGRPRKALQPASMSWDLHPSPHACHLTANALEALGDLERAEELLRMGWRLFPEAAHLPVQLAILLSDQGRHPEAFDILVEVPLDRRIPDDLQVFLFGMRSNLLAAMGRWAEAEEVLEKGLTRFPENTGLAETHIRLLDVRRRAQAEKDLAESWAAGLSDLEGSAAEVDEAIIRCGAVNELSEIIVLAGRRLWRAFLDHRKARPHIPDVWGAAVTICVLELDGAEAPVTPFARSVACNPSSVRTAIGRLRTFLETLDQEFARRGFAARTNPRLDGPDRDPAGSMRAAEILSFPTN